LLMLDAGEAPDEDLEQRQRRSFARSLWRRPALSKDPKNER
jgi:hypothetical protein